MGLYATVRHSFRIAWRAARERAQALAEAAQNAAAETEELTLRLGELDRLGPRLGEETEIVGEGEAGEAAEAESSDDGGPGGDDGGSE